METWSAHHLYSRAQAALGEEAASCLQQYAQRLRANEIPVIFSLRHLSQLTDVRYRMLHETVDRKRASSNFRMYAIKKRSGGRRFIHAVSSELAKVHHFINKEILQRCKPHHCSFAYHKDGGIQRCAAAHCSARWLFQFDLTDFFYDVSEIDCYRVFSALGYRSILTFELARICTTRRLPDGCLRYSYHGKYPYYVRWEWLDQYEPEKLNWPRPLPYVERFGRIGALPQGASTSPMLANLAAWKLDERLFQYALHNGLVYTRYADDITLSTCSRLKNRGRIQQDVISIIRKARFKENSSKICIAGPGSKKVVLGLLVDGDQPRISREFYRRVERLLYGAMQNGFESAATYNGFDSAYGLHNHLSGLIAYVKSVDEKRWIEFSARLDAARKEWAVEADA
jgi:RNA-directed DNA polymerase